MRRGARDSEAHDGRSLNCRVGKESVERKAAKNERKLTGRIGTFAILQVASLFLNETLKGHIHNHSYSPVTVDPPHCV